MNIYDPQTQNILNNYSPYSLQNYTTNYLKGMIVTSIDEVKGARIDMDGSIFIFPSIIEQKIYTKRILNNGAAEILEYSLVQKTSEETNKEIPLTRGDFEPYIKKIEEMDVRINNLLQSLGGADE